MSGVGRVKMELKPEPELKNAADKTRAVIQDLHSRLREASGDPSPSRDDLDHELQAYFSAEGSRTGNVLDSIREKVIEAVADRILTHWESGPPGQSDPVENAVVERLIARVLDRLNYA